MNGRLQGLPGCLYFVLTRPCPYFKLINILGRVLLYLRLPVSTRGSPVLSHDQEAVWNLHFLREFHFINLRLDIKMFRPGSGLLWHPPSPLCSVPASPPWSVAAAFAVRIYFLSTNVLNVNGFDEGHRFKHINKYSNHVTSSS